MANIFDDFIVLDGGFGTESEAQGCKIYSDPLWSSRMLLTSPESVVKVHQKFLEAGARIIETNSYQIGIQTLIEKEGMSKDKAIEVVQSSAKLARKAVENFRNTKPNSPKIFIAGSIGPYGVNLCDGSEYSGHYMETVSREDITSYFYDQAKALSDAGVDVLCFETIPALSEAQCILETLNQLPNAFAWISFSCKDKSHICHGEKFSEAAQFVTSHPRVVAVGINCTDPADITDLLKSAVLSTNNRPFIVYPNSGESFSHDIGGFKTDADRLKIENKVKEWCDLGAKAIGGCCRISPDDIAKIRHAMETLIK